MELIPGYKELIQMKNDHIKKCNGGDNIIQNMTTGRKNRTNNVNNLRYKWFIRLVRIITILWVALVVHWFSRCSAGNQVKIVDNVMTDYYTCINCDIVEDSTWAETIHWHNDTTCLYSLGMFVTCKDTLKCDTVRVKKLSKKLSELSDRIGPTVISVVNNVGIKRVCEKIKRVM